MYHYAGNNPIKYTDPDGMFSKEKIISQSTEDIDYAKFTEMGDKNQKITDIRDIGHKIFDFGLLVFGGNDFVSAVSVLTGYLGYAPDKKSEVNKEFNKVHRQVALLSQQPNSKGEKTSPDVQIKVTKTLKAVNEDTTYLPNGVATNKSRQLRTYVNTTSIEVQINGKSFSNFTYSERVQEVGRDEKSAFNWDDFSWTEKFPYTE